MRMNGMTARTAATPPKIVPDQRGLSFSYIVSMTKRDENKCQQNDPWNLRGKKGRTQWEGPCERVATEGLGCQG